MGALLGRRDVFLLALAAARPLLSAAPGKLPPADEASRDAALASLLSRIRRLTARRDARGLEALMLPTFRVEFDAGKGPAAFRKKWRPESRSSALWPAMERLFSLGGTFYSDTLFAVPYVFTQFPADLDPLGYVVAVKPNARLLDKPSPSAKQIAALDHDILPLAERLTPPVEMHSGRYLEVTPPSGRAYVAEADVYSPAAHRAFFEKRNGRWYWISFVCATLAEPPDLTKAKAKKRR